MEAKAKSYLIILVSACLSGLATILPNQLGLIAWVSVSGFFAVLFTNLCSARARLRHFYLMGLTYFAVFYACAFHFFFYMHPLDFTGIYGLASILVVFFCWIGLSALQAAISALFIMLIGAIARGGLFRRFRWALIPVCACTLVLLEWFQTVGWWGVPFARLSLSQTVGEIFFGSAAYFGSYFITLCIALFNAAFAYLYLVLCGKFEVSKRAVCARTLSLIALCVFVLNLTLGIVNTVTTDKATAREEKITVAVVQGNFSSKTAYSADPYDIIEEYAYLTAEVCRRDVDLVIWPETAIPYPVSEGGALEKKIAAIARKNKVPILYGALRYTDTYYNCTFLAHPDGVIDTTVYKKRHLVPFGEYMPMRDILALFLPFLEDISMLSSDMTPGEGTEIFEVDGIGKIGSIICFDSIYETLTRDTVRDGAELIALGTNDSWFCDSVAIYLHNNHARMRAVESARYIARAAVTGVSTVISPTGKILAQTELLCEDYAIGRVSLRSTRTLYSYIGDIAVALCFATILCAAGYAIYLKKASNITNDEIATQSGGEENEST